MFTNLERVLDEVDFKKIINFFSVKKIYSVSNLQTKLCCPISIASMIYQMIMVILQNAFVSGRENLASSPDTLDLPDPAYDAKE